MARIPRSLLGFLCFHECSAERETCVAGHCDIQPDVDEATLTEDSAYQLLQRGISLESLSPAKKASLLQEVSNLNTSKAVANWPNLSDYFGFDDPDKQEFYGLVTEWFEGIMQNFPGRRRRSTWRTYTPTVGENEFVSMMASEHRVELPDVECWHKDRTSTVSSKEFRFEGDSTPPSITMSFWDCICGRCKDVPFDRNTNAGEGIVNLASLEPSADHASCAVVFSSDYHLNDKWVLEENQNILPAEMINWCGTTGWYYKFTAELDNLMASDEWLGYYAAFGRCDRLIATGHGLGGALATLFATCANYVGGHRPLAFGGIRAEVELYTTSAPRTKLTAPENNKAMDGYFKGLRYYTWSSGLCLWESCRAWCCIGDSPAIPEVFDKVPCAAEEWSHPKMPSVGLDVMFRETAIDLASEEASRTQPKSTWVSQAWLSSAQLYAHTVSDYIRQDWSLQAPEDRPSAPPDTNSSTRSVEDESTNPRLDSGDEEAASAPGRGWGAWR